MGSFAWIKEQQSLCSRRFPAIFPSPPLPAQLQTMSTKDASTSNSLVNSPSLGQKFSDIRASLKAFFTHTKFVVVSGT